MFGANTSDSVGDRRCHYDGASVEESKDVDDELESHGYLFFGLLNE
jgi:hypothetical protein